jgi:hypothetical protein
MDDKKSYKPFLATDKEYLKKVAGAIKAGAPLEDIKFELLHEAILALGFSDNPYSSLDLDNLNVKAIQPIVDKTFEAIVAGISGKIKKNFMRCGIIFVNQIHFRNQI